jgi:hypothetical protein
MSALFLILAVLAAVIVGDAVVENTDSDTVTLFGQQITGLTQGALLLVAAGLGALTALLLVLALTASSRRRARRKDLRSTNREMEERVVDLERENAALRNQVATPGRQAENQPGAVRAPSEHYSSSVEPTRHDRPLGR